MSIAFVHEWLTTLAGSERVLESVAALYPDAPLYTLVKDDAALTGSSLLEHPITESFIPRLPMGRSKFRAYLPLFTFAFEQFDLTGHDVVFSSYHTSAKSVLTRSDQLHLCYCHTPMRFAWDLYPACLEPMGLSRGIRSLYARTVLHRLRHVDVLAAMRVDRFIANSPYVASRIWKTYRRPATVIAPPVDVEAFNPSKPRDDFYLVVSRLIPQKRVELIIEAFKKLDRPLLIIGDGPQRLQLQRLRDGHGHIQLLGYRDDATVRDHMQRCRAFVFAADEDFGIAPVEAMAAGAPVIAWGHGGALGTVIPDQTGILFDTGNPHPTPDALADAVRRFESRSPADQFDPNRLHEQAQPYATARFQREIKTFIDQSLDRFQRGQRWL